MRKTFISIVLLSVLGSIAVSCQKEKLIDQTAFVSETLLSFILLMAYHIPYR